MAYNNLRINGVDYPISGGASSWNDLADKPIKTVQTVLLSDAALEFAYGIDELGRNFWSYFSEDAAMQKKWDAAWNHASITIDGNQYLCEKRTIDANGTYVAYVGNTAAINPDAPSTGEPFLIICLDGIFEIVLPMDAAPEDTEATETHTISLTLENDVIQSDYLPAIPEFDLTAMGLPDIPIGGDQVSVACDTADLRAALDKGQVKLTFKATNGSFTSAASYIATAINMEGEYQVSFVGTMGTQPMMINISVISTAIKAKIVLLAVPTT